MAGIALRLAHLDAVGGFIHLHRGPGRNSPLVKGYGSLHFVDVFLPVVEGVRLVNRFSEQHVSKGVVVVLFGGDH